MKENRMTCLNTEKYEKLKKNSNIPKDLNNITKRCQPMNNHINSLRCAAAALMHSSFHPFTLTMNLNFRQNPQWSERKERGREEKDGVGEGGVSFLALSRLSDLVTLRWARQTSLPLPLQPFTFLATSSIFLKICHNMNMVGGRGGHHTCLRSV